MTTTTLWCCGCEKNVQPRLTDGREIYPHRSDLANLPFWRCDDCTNFVGCHHKTKDRTKPLGCIPTTEIKKARQHVHAILDPIWKRGFIGRRDLYAMIAERLGKEKYHTAEIRTVAEAREVYSIVASIQREISA